MGKLKFTVGQEAGNVAYSTDLIYSVPCAPAIFPVRFYSIKGGLSLLACPLRRPSSSLASFNTVIPPLHYGTAVTRDNVFCQSVANSPTSPSFQNGLFRLFHYFYSGYTSDGKVMRKGLHFVGRAPAAQL